MTRRIVILFLLSCLVTAAGFSQLKVQYMCGDHGAVTDNHIKPHFSVVNDSGARVDLSSLVIRYYYTKEGSAPEQFWVDYAQIGNRNVTGTFASGYFQIGFTTQAGVLLPCSSSGPIQLRCNKTDWSSYNEADDFSYGSVFAFTDWNNVELYENGVLVWGAGPSSPTPTLTPVVTPLVTIGPTAAVTATPVVTIVPTSEPLVTVGPSMAPTPTPVPTPDLNYDTGRVWIEPAILSVAGGSYFSTEVHVNSGDDILAGYQFNISYDASQLALSWQNGTYAVLAGAEGFVSAIDTSVPGVLRFNGVDPVGKGPSTDLHVATINWFAVTQGASVMTINVEDLINNNYGIIGIPTGASATITISCGDCGPTPESTTPDDSPVPSPVPTTSPVTGGDVNGDSVVDIVDALLILQYQVGLSPVGFDMTAADMNNDGMINIIDAYIVLSLLAGNDPIVGPTPDPDAVVGTFQIVPQWRTAAVGEPVPLLVMFDTGESLLAAYDLGVNYTASVLSIPSSSGVGYGVEPGSSGFIAAANFIAGHFVVAGFDLAGKGPGTIHLLTLNFTATQPGYATIEIVPSYAINPNAVDIGAVTGCVAVVEVYENGSVVPVITPGTINAPTIAPSPVPPEPTAETSPTPVATLTAEPTITPGPTPGSIIGQGNLWLAPASITAEAGGTFVTEVHVNTGDLIIGAYMLTIDYDPAVLAIDSVFGTNGAEAGADGFVAAANPESGHYIVSGFDAYGKGPGTDLHLITIHWIAFAAGATDLVVDVPTLIAADYSIIGVPTGIGSTVTVTGIMPDPTPNPTSALTPDPTPDSTPAPTSDVVTPGPTANLVSATVALSPATQVAIYGRTFMTSIMVNSSIQKVAAYGFTITYSSSFIQPDTNRAGGAIEAGADGFFSAGSYSTAGTLKVSGFDTTGKGPGSALEMLRIYWIATGVGSTNIGLVINDLTDEAYNTIQATAYGGTVTVGS